MKLRHLLLTLLMSFFSLQIAFAAETSFHDTNGKEIKLIGNNKWTVINYWADWCGSCVYEIPEMNRFFKKHPDVVMVGVHYDGRPVEELKPMKIRLGIDYPVVVEDPNELLKIGHISAIPATIIINPQGHIVKKIYGANTEKSLAALMKRYGKA